MSSSVDVRRRPDIWSYFSFSSAPRRRTSLSLPLKSNSTFDPFEKADRHTPRLSTASSRASFMNEYKVGSGSSSSSSSNMNQGQRTRYLKAGGIIAFILIIFFYLAPSHSQPATPNAAPAAPAAPASESKFPGGDVASDPSVATDRCTRSYSSDKPLVQYALMIDAGSTGSRIHVYRFNNCGPTPELEDEVFKMTPPKEGGSGLSSYKADAEGAAQSLDMLMDVAVESVPLKLQGCTPVAVKATAGLRKLGPELSEKILAAVRERLETKYPFPVLAADKGGVEVMEGTDEGVYAWITTNYLLGKIGGPDKTPTAAVFDLGGGSTQIVFEPTFPEAKDGGMPETLADGDHKYELNFGGRNFTLYQHSYLGYGLMAARENIHKVVFDVAYDEAKKNGVTETFLKKPVMNACLIPGTSRKVEIPLEENHPLGKTVTVEMTGPTEGAPAQCRGIAEKTLKKESECKIAPCAFNGVHQPPLEKTFSREDIYLFSYFYDRTNPLGLPSSFTINELKELVSRVCHGPEHWDVFHSIEGAMDELKDRPETCLDLNFMLALLHNGYEMPIDREVKIAKKIKGNELGWCLGASLPLLSQESGWQCKIKEVTK